MRTIQAPGVEINEIDKSQYAPTMAGTAALVMGFANKGEDYNTMQFTSRSSWLNYYGEPDNEAERYFYNACMEVINQNGILYSAKIPYENEAKDKYVTKKYTITTRCAAISSVTDYLLCADSRISNLLDGDFTSFGYGLSDLPDLSAMPDEMSATKEVLSTYALTIKNLPEYYEMLIKYNKQKNANGVAFPLFYRYTSTDADDNWIYYNQVNVADRLINLFDFSSNFWKLYTNKCNTKTIREFAKILRYLDRIIEAEGINTSIHMTNRYSESALLNFDSDVVKSEISALECYSPEDYIKAFIKGYEYTFTSNATAYESYNFVLSRLESKDLEDYNFADFINLAKPLFDDINNFVYTTEAEVGLEEDELVVYPKDEYTVATTTDAYPSNLVPYIYLTEDISNLPSYYSAAIAATEVKIEDSEVSKVLSSLNTFASDKISGNISDQPGKLSIDLSGFGDASIVEVSSIDAAPFIQLSSYFTGSLLIDLQFIDNPAMMSLDRMVELLRDLSAFLSGENSNLYKAIDDKLQFGSKVNTSYVSDLLDFYASHANITGYYDREVLYKDYATLDTLKTTVEAQYNSKGDVILKQVKNITIDDDGNELVDYDLVEDLLSTGTSFFEKYGNVVEISATRLSNDAFVSFKDHMQLLREEFDKTLTKSLLIKYINDVRALPAFKEIERYLSNTPTTAQLNAWFTLKNVENYLMYSEIRDIDDTIRNYFTIRSDNQVYMLSRDTIDAYASKELDVAPNSILITDITRSKYDKTVDSTEKEFVGLVPVVTTAANAMVAQMLINDVQPGKSYGSFQAVRKIASFKHSFADNGRNHNHKEFILGGEKPDTPNNWVEVADDSQVSCYSSMDIYSENDSTETLGDQAAGYFTTIQYTDSGELDRDNMYDIGVVVFKAFIDASEGNKISFQAVESFIGSLDKRAVDPTTGATKLIDEIVNTNSEYINLYSNCYASTSSRKQYEDVCDILIVEPQKAGTLGFYEDMMVEDISLTKSIYDGMEKVFDKNQDINEKEIDIVCDAGISNIAQFVKRVYGNRKGAYDPCSSQASMFKLKSRSDTLTWRSVLQKFDNFCKNVRKDCMFVADGLRPLCLQGNKKIIRETKPINTIDANILPFVKYMAGLNTNYGAGYCDWFQKADDFTGEYFWCPPSIQAMGIYIYTDVNANYFDAPAGLNRGVVTALDVAFSPTSKQAGSIYNQNWNYAINYPKDGIVLEGQKTFQVKPSAFDRVNVRRLFLRLERQTYKVARYFVYEGNTAYTRQRLIDTLDPIFADCKFNNGIYDYKIICDESINTPNVIDNNELRVKIGIKPVKTAEFILIDFIALSTGGSFAEM